MGRHYWQVHIQREGRGLQHERQGCYRARQRLLRGLAALADGDGWSRWNWEAAHPRVVQRGGAVG
jgi:hypothetical protein